jgi:hypothetical protein
MCEEEGRSLSGWRILFEEVAEKKNEWLGSVAHACDPSYSGGRDGDDHSLRSALKN